ncbi:hypothetical protein QJQ45_015493 [Haematococcus lacustris]|nr:hypothetical protein QJQ45_015493 [Haematococcus lacustris]
MACTHEAVAIVLSRAHTTKGGENVKPRYVDSLQPSGLKCVPWDTYGYPVHVWYDNPGKQMRVTFYNGLDETYVMPGMTYQVFPRITTKTCLAMNTTTGPTVPGSPTSSGNSDGGSDSRRAGRSRSEQQGPGPLDLNNPDQWLQDEDLPPPLPSLAGWTYSGTARLPSRPPSHVWQLTQRVQDKVNTYTWHVGQVSGGAGEQESDGPWR